MKIISWNLKNLGEKKLARPINPVVAAAGVGNDVLDYILRVVMGNDVWRGISSTLPADIFIIIELKTGGTDKGGDVSGAAIPTVTKIGQAMNAIAALDPQGRYHYSGVPLQITGNRYSVGIIYNERALTLRSWGVVRDRSHRFLLPRTPFGAQFSMQGTDQTLSVLGIHAPPPKGGTATRFRDPIYYCRQLADLELVTHPHIMFVAGDFNCNPASTYVSMSGPLLPFNGMTNYDTRLPSTSLTSLRQTLDRSQTGSAVYLKDYYDNVLYKAPGSSGTPRQYVMDLVGNNAAFADHAVAVLNSYWTVSDHLPVVWETGA
jgi:hypothetical protein